MRTKRPATCEACGTPIVQNLTAGRPRRYCSDRCRQRGRRYYAGSVRAYMIVPLWSDETGGFDRWRKIDDGNTPGYPLIDLTKSDPGRRPWTMFDILAAPQGDPVSEATEAEVDRAIREIIALLDTWNRPAEQARLRAVLGPWVDALPEHGGDVGDLREAVRPVIAELRDAEKAAAS